MAAVGIASRRQPSVQRLVAVHGVVSRCRAQPGHGRPTPAAASVAAVLALEALVMAAMSADRGRLRVIEGRHVDAAEGFSAAEGHGDKELVQENG